MGRGHSVLLSGPLKAGPLGTCGSSFRPAPCTTTLCARRRNSVRLRHDAALRAPEAVLATNVRGRRCASQTQPHRKPAPLLSLRRRSTCTRPSLRLSDAASSTASSTAATSTPHRLCASIAAPLRRSLFDRQLRCCRFAAAVLVRGHRCASRTQPHRQPAPLLPLPRRTACARPSLRLSDAASSTASSAAAASPPQYLCAAIAAPLDAASSTASSAAAASPPHACARPSLRL